MIVACPGCQSRYDVTGRPPGTQARCRCGTVFKLPTPNRSAVQLECPGCGGGVPPTSHTCPFCDAKLLMRACPRCFASLFHGAKHCTECGCKVDVPAAATLDGHARVRPCPRCQGAPPLEAHLVGDVLMDECGTCHGVWLDRAAVERVIAERRQVTADTVTRKTRAAVVAGTKPSGGRMYLKCPDCDTLMNRSNFGRCSGVIIDVCKSHGSWFDPDELPAIVDFVTNGGLEKAEHRRIEEMKQEVRRAKAQANSELLAARRTHSYSSRRASNNTWAFGGLLGAIVDILTD